MILGRDAILGHVDTRIATVDVPEMGGEVCVASLTAEEADRVAKLGDDGVLPSVRLVILCACDDQGNRLFTDEDAPTIAKLPNSAIRAIANKALEHNGLGAPAQEEAKND